MKYLNTSTLQKLNKRRTWKSFDLWNKEGLKKGLVNFWTPTHPPSQNRNIRSGFVYLALGGWYLSFVLSMVVLIFLKSGAFAFPTCGCHLKHEYNLKDTWRPQTVLKSHKATSLRPVIKNKFQMRHLNC